MTWVPPTTRVKGSARKTKHAGTHTGPLTRVVAFGRSYGRTRTPVLLVTSRPARTHSLPRVGPARIGQHASCAHDSAPAGEKTGPRRTGRSPGGGKASG